jgi:peptidoglycan hydrolase-like protein with peptidoglycan-binding domain
MSNLLFIDSAYPLGKVIAGASGVAFYVGGDTPHAWSKAEVDATPYRYRLPIFVRSNPPGPGAAADVAACVKQLDAIGCPEGALVAWDVETAVDAPYIVAVHAALKAAGYPLIIYASQSAIAGQGNPDGLYWGAQWTGAVHIAAGDAMTQYVDFGGYDESSATSALPFWDTQAKAPVPLPVPVPSGNPWPLQSGSNGANVVIIQDALNHKGYAAPPLAADGSFGPATLAAVRHAQGALKLAVTGIVDEVLWKALTALSGPPAAPPAGDYPVPASVTAVTAPLAVTVSWVAGSPVSPHWRVQVAADDAGNPGAVPPGGSVTAVSTHATVALPRPGRYWCRVQAAGDSEFTPWASFTV